MHTHPEAVVCGELIAKGVSIYDQSEGAAV